jgi:hypothetical protein
MIGLSLLHAELTRDATTGIVSDSATGLMWQDNMVGTTTNWQGAIDRCEKLILGPHSDWRLPNVNELKSIVDRSKVNPAIKDGFNHTSSSLYWSSTTYEYYKDGAWYVFFGNGYVYNRNKYSNSYVRCVRAGQ